MFTSSGAMDSESDRDICERVYRCGRVYMCGRVYGPVQRGRRNRHLDGAQPPEMPVPPYSTTYLFHPVPVPPSTRFAKYRWLRKTIMLVYGYDASRATLRLLS